MVEPPRGRTTPRRRLSSPATSRGAAWRSRGEGGVLVGSGTRWRGLGAGEREIEIGLGVWFVSC